MALASRGLRDLGSGLEPLGAGDLSAVQEQARRVHRNALAATVVYAAALLLLP
ncbi:MAG TPA: hypothetical protein VLH75_20210 [Longimicrobiales bacterium]|nr:hypothetical protein [Longimicrobiales bacterium]